MPCALAKRQSIVTTCARVTVAFGAKVAAVVPSTIFSLAAQRTASA